MSKNAKGSILIIENNELTRLTYKTQIEPLVEKLSMAKNAITTLNMINQYGNTFDLILLNIVLPDMNGFKLAEKLRKKGIKAPIIAISANDIQIEVQTIYRTIFSAFFVKPLTLKKIICLIEEYIKNKPLN